MRQPMIATAVPIQKISQFGLGKNAMPPTMNPTMTVPVPTQEMGLPELCSRCAPPASCASVPPVPVPATAPVPSTVSVACSATNSSSNPRLPMLRLSRKYRNEVRDSVAGPHLAYDDTETCSLTTCPIEYCRKEHDDKCLRS